MKNIIRTTLSITLIFLVLCSIVFVSAEVSPRYTYTYKLTATLEISGGQARAAGLITPYNHMKTAVIVKLQRLESDGWTTLNIWTGTNSGGTSEAGGTKAIAKGYDYRVYVTGKVYNSDGIVVETVSMPTDIKSY